MSLSISSMPYSLAALSPTSTQASTDFSSPMSNAFWKLKPSSGLTSKPTASEICFQWRSFMPFFRRATMRGTLGLNSSIYFLMVSAILRTGPMSLSLKKRMTPCSVLLPSSTNFSAETASSLSHSQTIHWGWSVSQVEVVSHRLENGVKSRFICWIFE